MGDWDIHDPTKECADLFRGPDGFYMPHKGKFSAKRGRVLLRAKKI